MNIPENGYWDSHDYATIGGYNFIRSEAESGDWEIEISTDLLGFELYTYDE